MIEFLYKSNLYVKRVDILEGKIYKTKLYQTSRISVKNFTHSQQRSKVKNEIKINWSSRSSYFLNNMRRIEQVISFNYLFYSHTCIL